MFFHNGIQRVVNCDISVDKWLSSGISKEREFLTVNNPPCLFLGLMVFPKPPSALEYTYSMSKPLTYEKFTEDLKRFLERKCAVPEEGELVVPAEQCLMELPLEAAFLACFLFLFSPFKHRQLDLQLSCQL